jgi:ABC-type Zn uptake system ZnuABC Zn-binding protein ZnuA
MLLILPFNSGADEHKLNIVATQTIFADLVRQVAGDRADVTAIASPKYNIHFIQPKPSDVRKVIKADLYVNAGLDLEAWSDPLLEAAARPELFRNGPRNVDVSKGVELLEVPEQNVTRAQGDIHAFGNPHYHMDPRNAKIMVQTILEKLKEIDPGHAAEYDRRAQKFFVELEAKIDQWKEQCGAMKGQEVISYHEDIAYFADFLGLKAEQFLEPKPGIPPTPKHLEALEEYARMRQVRAIVMPTYYPKKAAETLSGRIGVPLIVLGQGVGELPDTDDFFSFFDHNIQAVCGGDK